MDTRYRRKKQKEVRNMTDNDKANLIAWAKEKGYPVSAIKK
jgi:hypothetical protein